MTGEWKIMTALLLAVVLAGCSRREGASVLDAEMAQPQQQDAKGQENQPAPSDLIYEREDGPIYRSKETIQSEASYESGPYRVRLISYMRGVDEFLILREKKIVHKQVEDNGHFYSGAEPDERFGTKFLAVPVISDTNKNGIPDLVVRRVSSGNHCCCIYHIFELGKELKRTGEYSAANINNTSIFIDRDGDGVLARIFHRATEKWLL